MQISLSAAVIFVALSVVTAAAEVPVPMTEPTLSQKFEEFQHEVQSFVDNIGEKTKEAFRDLHHSELSTKTRNWFTENFQKLKDKFKATFSNEGSD
ncbi:apolipoprotein C-I [Rhineura floridana]|uniref:apolipoprotein C-I n=1 Tax=Rhineura floridana TaxID=261503 RepID=UPI002AC7F3B1|nr:apolipoprotein C-I [Rhineura floridana]XP_061453586.1 apolipoprotein C-I [Rhineura floridana]XP_061453587.1 apolipoprotein C-I [Rhineura floridana]